MLLVRLVPRLIASSKTYKHLLSTSKVGFLHSFCTKLITKLIKTNYLDQYTLQCNEIVKRKKREKEDYTLYIMTSFTREDKVDTRYESFDTGIVKKLRKFQYWVKKTVL